MYINLSFSIVNSQLSIPPVTRVGVKPTTSRTGIWRSIH